MSDVAQASCYRSAVWSLWSRECRRFVRQRSRVIGALGTPIIFWFIIGSGMGTSFRPQGVEDALGSLQYGYPGTMALVLLFTAIFSMISVIEDRQAGFLQGVLVAPIGRSAIVWGKVLGSTTLAVGQAALLLALAPAIGMPLTVMSVVQTLAVLLVMSIGLSALGFWIAWSMDSSQGFHAVMNLFLMPMWLLSGALFPASGASGWIRAVMAVNPLTYGVSALRQTLVGAPPGSGGPPIPMAWSLGIMAAFGVLMVVLSTRAAVRRHWG